MGGFGRGFVGGANTPIQSNEPVEPAVIGGGAVSAPSPALYAPLTAVHTNGQSVLTLDVQDVLVSCYATLCDCPPPGYGSQLDLTGASVTFLLRAVGAMVPVLNGNPARVIGTVGIGQPARVAYDFTSADMAQLSPGAYRGAFVAVWPEGVEAIFTGLVVQVDQTDA